MLYGVCIIHLINSTQTTTGQDAMTAEIISFPFSRTKEGRVIASMAVDMFGDSAMVASALNAADAVMAESEPAPVSEAGTHVYYPEMGDAKPVCDMAANLSYNGRHYFIRTNEVLKGRGIRLIDEGYSDTWNFRYQVTHLAYSKLEERFSIGSEALLD